MIRRDQLPKHRVATGLRTAVMVVLALVLMVASFSMKERSTGVTGSTAVQAHYSPAN